MPRRREITVDCLNIQWGADGTITSARVTNRTRPLAYEFGRVLLTLAGAAQRLATSPSAGMEPASAPSSMEVAALAQVSEREARAVLHDLLPSGCVLREHVRLARQRACARWAHGFRLAPEREIRGPGRRPRLSQLALLIEPSVPCGDLVDVVLRRCGLLTVQAVDTDEAMRLLGCIGFELVLADDGAVASLGWEGLARATCVAACGPLVALTTRPQLDHRSVPRARATLRKPFTPEALEAIVSRHVAGSTLSFPSLEGVSA